MRIGIHLPQFGRAIVPGGVQRAATTAEDLGFDDLYVSDHLVNPKEQPYPAPFILDPLQTLAFAADEYHRPEAYLLRLRATVSARRHPVRAC